MKKVHPAVYIVLLVLFASLFMIGRTVADGVQTLSAHTVKQSVDRGERDDLPARGQLAAVPDEAKLAAVGMLGAAVVGILLAWVTRPGKKNRLLTVLAGLGTAFLIYLLVGALPVANGAETLLAGTAFVSFELTGFMF